jgi:hypothetical protein
MPSSSAISAATRQQQYRQNARRQYGVRPYLWLLTPEEAEFLRAAFRARFGHDLSVGARRRARSSAVVGSSGSGSGEQMALL